MIDQDECSDLIDVAIKYGTRKKVDGIEAMVSASDVSTSRFANNGMTQNQSPNKVSLSVRVQKAGKQARLSTDQISPSAIRSLVDNAILAASYLEPDEQMLPMAEPEKRSTQKNVQRYDARTAKMTPAQRADAIAAMIEIAKESDLVAAGVYASGTIAEAIGNSNGLFRYHRESHAEVSITMKRVDPENGSESTGWAKADNPKATAINTAELASRAARKAVASANPEEIEPGKYTVILEPSAVLDLMNFVWYDFTATSHVDKLSCFLGKVGHKVLGQNISIVDDVFHPMQAGAPFDGEGLQRRVVPLVEAGTIANLVYGRRSAAELKMTPTGHGLPEPSPEGEWPLNLVMTGGTTSLEEMIRSTDRGILLTRVWYVREVDPTTKIVTGMTRDGTFLVEGGVIKSGIKNFRFNQSLIEMLNNVVALSPSERTAGEEGFPAIMPALKIDNFHFSSVTRF